MDGLPDRRTLRLGSWDYDGPGWYFVTICTRGRAPLLGSIRMTERAEGPLATLHVSWIGDVCLDELSRIGEHIDYLWVDSFVIMPNHVHLLVSVAERAEGGHRQNNPLSTFVGSFKRAVLRRVHLAYPDLRLWQRSFDERVIRDERHLDTVRTYIQNNPVKWAMDRYHIAD